MKALVNILLLAGGGFLVYETGRFIGVLDTVDIFKKSPARLKDFGISCGTTASAPTSVHVVKKSKKHK